MRVHNVYLVLFKIFDKHYISYQVDNRMYGMNKFLHKNKVYVLDAFSLIIKHPARPANKVDIELLFIQPRSKLKRDFLRAAKVKPRYYDGNVFFHFHIQFLFIKQPTTRIWCLL